LDVNATKRSLFRQLWLLNPELLEANNINTAATYYLFGRTFNFKFNVAIGFPRSDLCDTCELLKNQIAAATRERNEPMQQQLQQQRMQHWTESEVFYNKLRTANNDDNENEDIIVCADYEKNFSIPVTGVNKEYFNSNVNFYNFWMQNLKTHDATMALYAQHFAWKGANGVAPFLQFHIRDKKVGNSRNIKIFMENAVGTNKNRFVFSMYWKKTAYAF